ncbi:MAG: hypothetical protein WCN95_00890, partial [bacterium]
PYAAPKITTSTSSRSTVVRNSGQATPAIVQSHTAQQPLVSAAPATRPQTAESRTSALLDILRLKTQNNGVPANNVPAAVQPSIKRSSGSDTQDSDNSSKSGSRSSRLQKLIKDKQNND